MLELIISSLFVDFDRILFVLLASCPNNLFLQSRLEFPSSYTLDHLIQLCSATTRWLSADQNNIILLCAAKEDLNIIAACTIYYTGEANSPAAALTTVIQNTQTKLFASLRSKNLTSSQKKLFADLSSVAEHDKTFPVPKLQLRELIIHKLPQQEESGCRLMIMLIQGNVFLYTSMQHGGGYYWIPTTNSDPLTVVVPMNVQVTIMVVKLLSGYLIVVQQLDS